MLLIILNYFKKYKNSYRVNRDKIESFKRKMNMNMGSVRIDNGKTTYFVCRGAPIYENPSRQKQMCITTYKCYIKQKKIVI